VFGIPVRMAALLVDPFVDPLFCVFVHGPDSLSAAFGCSAGCAVRCASGTLLQLFNVVFSYQLDGERLERAETLELRSYFLSWSDYYERKLVGRDVSLGDPVNIGQGDRANSREVR